MAVTDPTDQTVIQHAPRLTLAPSVVAPDGSFHVHKDYQTKVEPWTVEAHISPVKAAEKFGDVESWANYVLRFASAEPFVPFLTWSEVGLRGVLDYHTNEREPGRCQWVALHPFERSVQWIRWSRMADGRATSQRDVLEFLEDNAPDIVEPEATKIVAILRKLRATVNATAMTELKPDGSSSVAFTKDKTIQAGEVELPPSIAIGIPLLKGHMGIGPDERLSPVIYRLDVKLRVSVDDNTRLMFRLSIPRSEQAFEDVFADRVAAANEALGEELPILRATNGG